MKRAPSLPSLLSLSLEEQTKRLVDTIDDPLLPAHSLNPSLRLSLAPDGQSIVYSTVTATQNLWLMAGLETVLLP